MLQSVQIGRGLAALAVCLLHLSLTMADPRYLGFPVFREYTRLGYLGVDFFFVLSGFIILHAHSHDLGQPRRWRGYVRKRLLRLYPAYWLYTAGFCGLLVLGWGPADKLPASGAAWLTTFSLLPVVAMEPPLSPAWTLFHEVGFYAVFSVAVWHRGWGLAAMGLWVVVCGWGLFDGTASADESLAATYLSVLNIHFATGMVAHYILQRARVEHRGGYFCAAVLAFGLAVPLSDPPATAAWARLLFGLAFAALLVAAVLHERAGPLRWSRVGLALGNASYSIYLTHEALSGLALKLALGAGLGAWLDPRLLYLLVLGVTLGAGWLAYRVVELRCQALARRWLWPSRDAH